MSHLNTEHAGISYGFLLELLQRQGWKCALSGLPMSDVPGDPMAMTVNKVDVSGEYVEGNVQIVCAWVFRARGDLSNNEFRRIFVGVKNDGWFLGYNGELEPDSIHNAFLCLVRDAVFDEFWGSIDLHVSDEDGRLDVSCGDWWLVRVDFCQDEGMVMCCRWGGLVSGKGRITGRPGGWPEDDAWVPVDIGDTGSVGKILELVRLGLTTVREWQSAMNKVGNVG